MRRAFRLLAAAMVLAALAVWLATGANCGWTKTTVAIERKDDVTGLTYQEYQKRFAPGVDSLGVAGVAALALALGSFLFKPAPRAAPPITAPHP